VLPAEFRFLWVGNFPGPINIPYTRERGVTFLETKKGAHPIGNGRSLADDQGFYVLQYSTRLKKEPNILGKAYQLSEKTVAHCLLAARVKTYSTAHSDYRGLRRKARLGPRAATTSRAFLFSARDELNATW
jgi:hypothetical protein